jgi:hypothetical protein
MVLKHGLTAFCIATGLAAPALAQTNQDHQAALTAFVTGLHEDIVKVVFADMDQDGQEEALLIHGGECGPAGCLFSVVDDFDTGTYQIAANQYGYQPALIQNDTVIDASGVYWVWNGRNLYPHGNALKTSAKQTGTVDDVEAIEAYEPWRTDLSRFKIEAYDLDLFDDERLERVLYVKSLSQAIDQAFPFYILDADGQVVDGDVSLDLPQLYTRSDRKAAQYTFSYGNGFRVKMVE